MAETMRQSLLLRFLIAMLVGVWSPLCCCQASTFFGGACLETSVAESAVAVCCHGTCDAESTSQPIERDEPLNDQDSVPGQCSSCLSCQGIASGAGLNELLKMPSGHPAWNPVASLALLVLIDQMALFEVDATHFRPRWTGVPPYLQSNRASLRWHCSLLV